jgi:hypothetical protein
MLMTRMMFVTGEKDWPKFDDNLFKECYLADLSFYQEGKVNISYLFIYDIIEITMRWRTKSEVINGKGIIYYRIGR